MSAAVGRQENSKGLRVRNKNQSARRDVRADGGTYAFGANSYGRSRPLLLAWTCLRRRRTGLHLLAFGPEVLQGMESQRRRKTDAFLFAAGDRRNQILPGYASRASDLVQSLQERILETDAGMVAIDHDAMLLDS